MKTLSPARYLLSSLCLCASVVQFSSFAHAQTATEGARLLRTDSRAGYVHRLTLYDRDGQAINPEDKSPKPYSPKITCGKCHEYGLINHGWHFNAGLPEEPMAEQGTADGNQTPASSAAAESPIQNRKSKIENPTSNPQSSYASPGRPGEPWIFTDPDTGTQIPLSYRDWPGTFRPADIGLTPWKFVQTFGRHLPGGGIFDPDSKTAAAQPEAARWKISGGLEIDCMVCHAGAGSGYDAGEIARQVARENLAWIPTAALGLGVIRGDAKKVPDDFDPDAIMAPDQTGAKLPEVAYNKALFDADQRVYFDIVKDPPAERCYFCHSVREVGPNALPAWQHEGDVHLAAGLRCSDCHVNGIDHRMRRGDSENGTPSNLSSCVGCHLDGHSALEILKRRADEWSYKNQGTRFSGILALSGDTTIETMLGGRFRAPRPQHAGIPPLHFEKLTCTACHGGSWPTDDPKRVQSSMAHGLGVSTKERREDDGPVVLEPIFTAEGHREFGWKDKVSPNRLLWPAYWAKCVDGKFTPLHLDAVQKAAKKILQRAKKKSDAHGPLTDDEITLLLKSLTKAAPAGGREPATGSASTKSTPSTKSTVESSKDQVVYLRDGNAYSLADGDKLNRETLATERPYLWPLAHDVRPARQALGARGCTDCHAENTAIFTGKLAATAQIPGTPLPVASMDQLIGYDPKLAAAWAQAFKGRTAFKIFALLSTLFMAHVLLRKTILTGVHFAPANTNVHSTIVAAPTAGASAATKRICWRMLTARILVLLGLLGGAATSFSALIPGNSSTVSGSTLQIHMFAAPVFIAGLVLIAWLWACDRSGRHGHGLIWNLTLGLALLAGLIVTGTMVAAMSPYFGYDSQRTLLSIHRWSSLAVLFAFPLHWLCSFFLKHHQVPS